VRKVIKKWAFILQYLSAGKSFLRRELGFAFAFSQKSIVVFFQIAWQQLCKIFANIENMMVIAEGLKKARCAIMFENWNWYMKKKLCTYIWRTLVDEKNEAYVDYKDSLLDRVKILNITNSRKDFYHKKNSFQPFKYGRYFR
jgi:hypothetical protein